MEMLNQIHLRGIVGNACAQKVGDTEVCRFSVMTEYAYTGRDGCKVVDVTWHNVTAFRSPKMADFSTIVKGAGVDVKGRLRNYRFTDSNGAERTMTEVVASEVKVLGENPSTL
jgi:single-strand DNA-binding protein